MAAGADLIDVKEPRGGSLGAASPKVLAEVVRAVGGRRPVSAALGELKERLNCTTAGNSLPVPPQIQFAKLGLAGCADLPDWQEKWRHALAGLSPATAPVAVIYADWQLTAAPPPRDVLAAARQANCRALLVDTFDKRGPGLMGLWSLDELRQVVRAGRDLGQLVVLAGQLRPVQFATLLPLEPDFLAVRGAACRADRTGRIDPQLVRELRRCIDNRGCVVSRPSAWKG
jgi:(5-formylfuran-3-yl)methyl phosphate synthase